MMIFSFLNQLSNMQKIVLTISVLGILVGAVGIETTKDASLMMFFENLHWSSSYFGAAFIIGLEVKKSKTNISIKHLKWFFIGFTTYALGQLIWDIQVLLSYSAFPAPSDLFYLWLGPSLTLALYHELNSKSQKFKKIDFWLDFLALSVATLTLLLIYYLPRQGSFDTFAMAILVLYPITLFLPVLMLLLMIPTLRLHVDTKLVLFLIASSVNAWMFMGWNSMALDGEAVNAALSHVIFSIAILIMGVIASTWKLRLNKDNNYQKKSKLILNLLPMLTIILSIISIIIASKLSTNNMVQELSYFGAGLVSLFALIRLSRLLYERDKLVQVQEELISSSSLLNSIIQAVPARIFWKDRDLNYLGSNDLFAQDAGLKSANDLIGKNDYDMIWKEQAKMYRADDFKVMQSGKAILGYEEAQTTVDGDYWRRTSKVPLINESTGETVGMLGIFYDITEQKRIDEHLTLQNYIFKESQKLAHIGSWRLDLLKNKLTWSDEIYRIFEIDSQKEEPSYDSFLNGIHPDDRDAVNSAYTNSLETQKKYQIIHRLLMQDGRIKYVQEQCETTFDDKGQPLVSLGTVQDITEQIRIENQLKENQLIMTQQARFASMGEMIGNIAHQWRQPLNALSLSIQKLPLLYQREKLTEQKLEEITAKSIQYIEEMSRTIDDFRNFFNPRKDKKNFLVKDSIDQAYGIIEATLKNSSIKYSLSIEENKELYGYANELSQVIINLFNNAKDALIENKIADGFIHVDVKSGFDYLDIVISDNAGGIPESIINKIFDPYFTTKEQGKGTGVGLYMSKTIVEDHMDGKLFVQSNKGETSFTIRV